MERKPLTEDELNAIALDLEACDIGLGIAKGKLRKKYHAHRKACLAAIKADNELLGLKEMSIDEILAELNA